MPKKQSFVEWLVVAVVIFGVLLPAITDYFLYGLQTQNIPIIVGGLVMLYLIYKNRQ